MEDIMWRTMLVALTAFVILATTAPSFAGQDTFRRFSDDELVQLMRGEGYDSVTLKDKGFIHIEHDGVSYALINQDDGDLQAYYGVRGYDISFKDMNEWNKNFRLSRAYLDNDNDPVLETDLLANGGMTIRNVTEMMRIFMQSVDRYRLFLNEHNRR
jgi:hypothetical protein